MKKIIPILFLVLLNTMANAQTPDSIKISREINKISSAIEITLSYNNTHIVEKYTHFKYKYWYQSTDTIQKKEGHDYSQTQLVDVPINNPVITTCDSLLQIIRCTKLDALLSKLTDNAKQEEFYDSYLLESTFQKEYINPLFANNTFCKFDLEKIAIELAPIYKKLEADLIQLEQTKVDSLNGNRSLITKTYVDEYVLIKSRYQLNPSILCLLLAEKLNYILSNQNEINQFNYEFMGSYIYKNVDQSLINEVWSALEQTKIRNSLYRAIKRTFKKLQNKQ